MNDLDVQDQMLKLVNSVKVEFSSLSLEDLAYKICQKYKVKINVQKLDEQDGFFDNTTSTIVLNDNVWFRPRRLFTLFHEICHMLIAVEGEEIIETLTSHAKSDYEDVEEELCDLGASEFLISNQEIENIFQNIDINTFITLLEKYSHASAPAIARKLANLYPERAIFMICCLKNEAREGDHVVEYAFSSKKMLPYRVRRFLSVPNNHLFCFDYNKYSGTESNGETVFPFKKTWTCYGEYFVENGRLYGILHQKKPVDKSNQLSLL